LPVLPLACPNAQFQPVYVGDVANAFVNSLDDLDTFNQTYDLCGPRVYILDDLVRYVAQMAGVKKTILPLCNRLSYFNAWAMEFKPGNKLMTRDDYYAMQVPNVCAGNAPANWTPAALEAVAPAWFRGASQRGHYDAFRNQAHR
jgi:NADH dehydrogenase